MCVLVAQSRPTLRDPMNCSPPSSSVREILQARLLEWVAIPFSRRSSQSRNWTQVSWIAGRFFSIWATKNQRTWLWGRGLCGDMSIKGRLIWDDEFGAVVHSPSSPGISPRAPAKDRRALSSSGKQAVSDLTMFLWEFLGCGLCVRTVYKNQNSAESKGWMVWGLPYLFISWGDSFNKLEGDWG